MNHRKYTYMVFLLTAVLLGHPFAMAQQNVSTDSTDDTESRILEKALDYTGFDQLEGYSISRVDGPRLQWHNTDNTPFIHHYFTEGTVWRVTFKDVVVTSKEAVMDSTHEFARDFAVYIHPASEKLLKIESIIPKIRWEYPPAVSAEERQAYWQKSGVVSMVLPDTLPAPFAEVLKDCPHSPYLASELVGLFVHKTYYRAVKTPVRWEVHLRGVAPIPFFGQGAENVPPATTVTIYADPLTGKTVGETVPGR